MLSRLLAHVSVYTAGGILVTVAGLISFPIYTRLFAVDEYGLISLISALLLFLVGIAKLGVQHSIVRFYGEVVGGKRAAGATEFYSTVLLALAGTGLAATLLWATFIRLVPDGWWNDPRARALLLLTAVLVFLRTTDSAMVNILRAHQRSVAFNVYVVMKKYAAFGAVLVTIFFVLPGVEGFYAGTILVEAVAVCILFTHLRRQCQFSFSAFSPPLYRSMLAFGIPMVALEVGAIVLNIGDRFVIQHLLGGESVGLYSAAYNLCEYIQAILIASISQAIGPMYLRLWEEKGEAETRQFMERALHYFIMLGAAIVAGVGAVATDLLALLASEKYVRGAVIIPYVVAGMVLGGANSLLAVGLNIHKQTRVLAGLFAGCAVLNLVLNVLLIPHFGIEGAAMSTLASYACLSGLVYRASNRRFPIALPWTAIAKFALLAVTMYAIVTQVELPISFASVAAKIALGAGSYAMLVLAFDPIARVAALGLLRRVRLQ